MSIDWIDNFMELTAAVTRSPASFRLWAGISAIACALERRVWTITDVDRLYPNLYTVLSGDPASGKTIAVKLARDMLVGIRGLTIGPDNPTPESFIDALENSAKSAKNGSGAIIHSAMSVMCREFGVLIPKYNEAFFATLSQLYDNETSYTSPRRISKSSIIENPTVNILAAATPAALGSMPEAAWGEGFTSRVVFVYGSRPQTERRIFKPRAAQDYSRLKTRLEEIFNDVHGEISWSIAAQDAMENWYNVEQMAPVPDYGRLVNYLGRRDVHTMKLAIISAISSARFEVALADFERAKQWLLETEAAMPNVFRAITQKSDKQIIDDVHHFLYSRYSSVARDQRKPISTKVLLRFLEDKVTSDKIPRIIDQMTKSGRIRQTGFGEVIPMPIDYRVE